MPRSGAGRQAHAQHVAEQDVVEVHVGLDGRVEHDPQREHAGEDHAQERVLLDAAVLLQPAREQRAGHSGEKAPSASGRPSDIGQPTPGSTAC
jgi:hypothetical protein